MTRTEAKGLTMSNDTTGSLRELPPAFTCPGCTKRHTFGEFAAGVFNETMLPGEAAPVCDGCLTRAKRSRKVRRRIERAVRKHRPADRVVMMDVVVVMGGAC